MTVTINDLARKVFEADGNDAVGNSLNVATDDYGLNITIENPWSGDSATGFGRTAYIDISKDDALALAEFIRKLYS